MVEAGCIQGAVDRGASYSLFLHENQKAFILGPTVALVLLFLL